MPVEAIISALMDAARKYHEDEELKKTVDDAVEALAEVDAELDKAFNDGKYAQLEADFDALIREVTA